MSVPSCHLAVPRLLLLWSQSVVIPSGVRCKPNVVKGPCDPLLHDLAIFLRSLWFKFYVASASVLPGSFMIEVNVEGNVYAKSMSSGTTDLSIDPLVVQPGTPQEPIRIELAEGAVVDGIVIRNGRPVRAFVYAYPTISNSNPISEPFSPLSPTPMASFTSRD
jgi:hypothetical protein